MSDVDILNPDQVDLLDIPDGELPGMWERADFTGGKTDFDEPAATGPTVLVQEFDNNGHVIGYTLVPVEVEVGVEASTEFEDGDE